MKSIDIPRSEDGDEQPIVSDTCICDKCRGARTLWQMDTRKYEDSLGYMHTQIRIRYWCNTCKDSIGFRLGGMVVKQGRYVHKEDEFLKEFISE